MSGEYSIRYQALGKTPVHRIFGDAKTATDFAAKLIENGIWFEFNYSEEG